MRDRSLPGIPGARVQYVEYLSGILEGAVRVGPYSVGRPGALLRVVPGLATFLARDGNLIECCPGRGADGGAMDALLQGPLTAALIHQRGELPLHGAALVPPGGHRALAIIGPQGAGKSTLAYELVDRGWGMLSDDLTRITAREGRILAWPGRRGIKLCPDACAGFGLEASRLPAVPGERGKVLVPVRPPEAPVPLGLVLVLDRGGPEGIGAVQGAAALACLGEHTFRPRYIQALGQARAHMGMISALLTQVRVLSLGGRGGPGALGDLVAGLVPSHAMAPCGLP